MTLKVFDTTKLQTQLFIKKLVLKKNKNYY